MRLALLTDIHEDLPSLQKVLRRLSRTGYDRLICLGDIAGYSPKYYSYPGSRDAHACLELLREREAIIIPGNHDLHEAGRIPEHSDIFSFPPDWYKLSLEERSERSGGRIWLHEDQAQSNFTSDDMDLLGSLPEFRVLEDQGTRILLSHFAYPNLSGFAKTFYRSRREFDAHLDFMASHGCSIGFMGHAHVQGYLKADRRSFEHYAYGRTRTNGDGFAICLPPVTRNNGRRGFCIFDRDSGLLQVRRQLF